MPSILIAEVAAPLTSHAPSPHHSINYSYSPIPPVISSNELNKLINTGGPPYPRVIRSKFKNVYPWRSDRIQHTVIRIWEDTLFADYGVRNNNRTNNRDEGIWEEGGKGTKGEES
jgi:hypothetical protein